MLEIRGLKKRYGHSAALDGVNLDVAAGDVTVIMGPSGCGKSTLVRCINRLVDPDEGTILFQGKDITRVSDSELRRMRKQIGFVFQHFNLVHRLTVLENVMMGLVLGGMDPGEAKTRALESLRKVQMDRFADKHPAELSGGEKQRVGIARALAQEPALLIWDEPTASLDPIMVGEVVQVIEELASDPNRTMLVVTHEVPLALRVAHKLVLMERGRVVEEGEPSAVMNRPRSEVGKKYHELVYSHWGRLNLSPQRQEKRPPGRSISTY